MRETLKCKVKQQECMLKRTSMKSVFSWVLMVVRSTRSCRNNLTITQRRRLFSTEPIFTFKIHWPPKNFAHKFINVHSNKHNFENANKIWLWSWVKCKADGNMATRIAQMMNHCCWALFWNVKNSRIECFCSVQNTKAKTNPPTFVRKQNKAKRSNHQFRWFKRLNSLLYPGR